MDHPRPPAQLQPESVGVPGEQELPARMVATPGHLPVLPKHVDVFWMPGWSECARLMGWRWIVVVGIVLLIAGVIWALTRWWGMALGLSGLAIKAAVLAIGAAITLVAWLRRNACRLRPDLFCIHCGYSLTGLEDGSLCPECGRRFVLAVCEEYKRDPHWFIERCKVHMDHPTQHGTLDVPRPGASVPATPPPPPSAPSSP